MRSRWIPLLVVPVAVIGAAQAQEAGQAKSPVPEQVGAFFEQHCVKCHGGPKPKAELALDELQETSSVPQNRETWEKILDAIELRAMPPEPRPRPMESEYRSLARWIETALDTLDCTGKKYPGRVTLHRLNRAEYDNTIRDLLGVDFYPAADFPSDDVGHGFDNIADVLTLPPLLMEKYLNAAGEILDRVVVTNPARRKTRLRDELRGGKGNAARGLYSPGDVTGLFTFPVDGEYILRAKAHADQAGPDPARMSFRVDARDVQTVDVTAERDRPETHEIRLAVTAGEREFAVRFVNDYYRPNDPDPKKRGDRNLYVHHLEVEGPVKFKPVKITESHKRLFSCGHDLSQEHGADCAEHIIEQFATRAYRRPVKQSEVDRLLTLVELARAQGERFEDQIKVAAQAVLVSPHFLFRVELDARQDELPRPVSDFELASRLSYFLWSSMPDRQLFELAERGSLRAPGVLAVQVERMLRDEKSRALVDNFASQWLNLRNLELIEPDPELFPGFDDDLRSAMLRETEMFFAAVMDEDRSVLDFLTGDFTFVNETLARHYNLSAVKGEEFRRVSFPSDERGGILTHASILTLTSNPTRTSPVKRGKWILENLLGMAAPPPPAGVEELDDGKQVQLSGSLRQRMEQHRAKPVCASCHNRMDPLGFGFENFDAVGAYRDRDGKFPIDASGMLPSGESFDGPAGLRALLRKTRRDQFCCCLTEKMLTYAIGRGLEYYDKCAVDEILESMQRNDYKFSSLIMGVVNSTPFQMRGSKGDD